MGNYKPLLRYGFVSLLTLSDVFLAVLIVSELKSDIPDPGVSALLGTLIGGITGALGVAVKDLYDGDDNGQVTPPK